MVATSVETALFSAALFVVLSSGYVYQTTDSLVGRTIGVPFQTAGSPTKVGIAVHALVFAGLLHLFLTKA